MATIIRVRRALAPSRTHLHVVGVCDVAGRYYRLSEVLAALAQGESWPVHVERTPAHVRTSGPELCAVDRCSYPDCDFGPCTATGGDPANELNLLYLPPC